MQVVRQSVEDLLASLDALAVDWQDDKARLVIERLRKVPIRAEYTHNDIRALLDEDFNSGKLMCQLFLGLSKDGFTTVLDKVRGSRGSGVKGYRADPNGFVADLVSLGLLSAMQQCTNAVPVWSDVLVERLRSGRGSAIAGQRRGRGLEDFVEGFVRDVFGDQFDARCNFVGRNGKEAKCDFAIPTLSAPRIVIEAKGYGATGSKMTDVLGDLSRIIEVKRADTVLLFVTDGLTWKARQSDLRKIVAFQNNGDIARIYTSAMAALLQADLEQLKLEAGL